MGAKRSRTELRRMSRAAALQLLFFHDGKSIEGEEWERVTTWFWEEFWLVPERTNVPVNQRQDVYGYCSRLVNGVQSFSDEIESTIKGASENWGVNRMGRVDRNVLRLSTYELLHEDELPDRVAINEGIELAKLFGNERSGGFVNGLLDRIARGKE